MGLKRVLGIAGLSAALGAAGIIVYNDWHGGKGYINYLYCTADSLFNGFDRNEITEVTVALYAEQTLGAEIVKQAVESFGLAAAEYMRQFGISLRVIDFGLRMIPDNAGIAYMKEIGSPKADINIFFTNEIPFMENKSYSGWADSANTTIQVCTDEAGTEYMRNLLIHEIAHLFYAGHTNTHGCRMNPDEFWEELRWCDDELETIEKYKHRLW